MRWVLSTDWEAPLGSPSWSFVAGMASAPSRTTPPMSTATRWRTTNRAQPAPAVLSGSAAERRATRPAWVPNSGIRVNLATFVPAKPSIAGTSVNAISMATATEAAAARPMTVRNGMPTTLSPHSAMITVRAAKTTELPAVPIASGTDSSGVMPVSRLARCRDRTNRP